MAAPYSLRGIEAKKKFVRNYSVRCVLHSALPPDTKAACCCGKPLEGKYFRFRYGKDGKDLGDFYAGPGCGIALREASAALGKDVGTPRYFDPLGLLSGQQETGTPADADDWQNPGVQRAPSNREMIEAISLLFYFWKEEREGHLFSVRNQLRNNPKELPPDSALRTMNKAIKKTYKLHGMTLRQALAHECQRLKVRGRAFPFPHLEHQMEEIGEECLL